MQQVEDGGLGGGHHRPRLARQLEAPQPVLLGRDGDETVSAEALAGWAGTIHYEITTRVNPQLPRVAVNAPA